MTTRRQFIGATLAGSLIAALGLPARAARAPMKLLILGGTGFLGPHIVEAAVARGHAMTLFNRGKTNPGLFPDLEKLHGDRKDDMSALQGRTWDAVIDTSGYVPADVERAAETLGKNVSHYVFISTTSVYAVLDRPGLDETAPVGKVADPNTTEVTNETYGPLKALCEQAAEAAFPGRATSIRPGLLVGPGDPTDRFTYWPARLARGGEVLAPNSGHDPTQFIDARDLAAFVVTAIEDAAFGIYNADSQAGALTMGGVLEACRKHAPEGTTLTWAPTGFLEKHNVAPWADLPIWLPATGANAGFGRVSTAKAKAAGLTYRPLEATVADTLEWFGTLPEDRRAQLRAGLPPDREVAVLAAWHALKAGE
jgi:2'-hydroxyisoflavone reductase